MKVTFLAINYAPSVGGAQSLVRHVAEGLVRRHGHDVTVVTTDTLHAPAGVDPGRLPVGVETVDGVEVHRLPVARRTHSVLRSMRRVGARLGRPIRPSMPAYGPWGRRLLVGAAAAAQRSDVVVGVSAPYSTVAAAVWTARRADTAVVALPILHLGEWTPNRSLLSWLAQVDRCVALTGTEAAWLVAHGIAAGRVSTIPPGCDPVPSVDRVEARARLGLADGRVVAFVGRLAANKGIDTLLDAGPALLAEHHDLTLLVAGRRTGWALGDAIERLPRELRDRVVVLTDVSDEVRSEVFAASDLVVVPSREEAFGMVILEAWASQRAVVASDIPAVRAVLRDGSDGRLVPPGDAAALRAAVSDLLGDPATADGLAASGAGRIEREFAWDTIVDRWHDELTAAHATHARREVS